jgi:hypothetical protein
MGHMSFLVGADYINVVGNNKYQKAMEALTDFNKEVHIEQVCSELGVHGHQGVM